MIRKPVASSACARLGYDPIEQILEVEFAPKEGATLGAVWQYCPVDASLALRLTSGQESVGRLLHAIKSAPSIAQRRVEESDVTCPNCGTSLHPWMEYDVCGTCEQAQADLTAELRDAMEASAH